MAEKFYQTKVFKRTEDEWYKKLKDSTFNDIEDTTRSDRPLKSWHSLRFQRVSIVQRDAVDVYYHKAKELLNTFNFSSNMEKLIWSLHADGLSKRKIERETLHMDGCYKREMIGIIIARIAKDIK